MKVLVCGGRDFFNRVGMYRTLDALHAQQPILLLIHGGAQGADSLAWQWARQRNIAVRGFPAEWDYGGIAGQMRNEQMLQEKPDLVVAFPGGRGTGDMLRRARAAGVDIFHYSVHHSGSIPFVPPVTP